MLNNQQDINDQQNNQVVDQNNDVEQNDDQNAFDNNVQDADGIAEDNQEELDINIDENIPSREEVLEVLNNSSIRLNMSEIIPELNMASLREIFEANDDGEAYQIVSYKTLLVRGIYNKITVLYEIKNLYKNTLENVRKQIIASNTSEMIEAFTKYDNEFPDVITDTQRLTPQITAYIKNELGQQDLPMHKIITGFLLYKTSRTESLLLYRANNQFDTYLSFTKRLFSNFNDMLLGDLKVVYEELSRNLFNINNSLI